MRNRIFIVFPLLLLFCTLSYGQNLVAVEDDNGKYGFKREGEVGWVVKPKYDQVGKFSEGLCSVAKCYGTWRDRKTGNIWERNGNMVTLMKQVRSVFLLSLNGLGTFTMAAPRICSMTENFGYISGMDILMFQETLSFLQIFPERTTSRTDMLLSHGLTRI